MVSNSADGTKWTPSQCLNIHLDERKRPMSNRVNGDTMFPQCLEMSTKTGISLFLKLEITQWDGKEPYSGDNLA